MQRLTTLEDFQTLKKNDVIIVSDGTKEPPKHHTRKHKAWTYNNYVGYFYSAEHSCGRFEVKVSTSPDGMMVNCYDVRARIFQLPDEKEERTSIELKPKLIKVDEAFNARLKSVLVYHPASNARNAALLDPKNDSIIGFTDSNSPYFPAGGRRATEDIADGDGTTQGLVIGCEVLGYPCWHCHDDVYRLGSKPE